MIQSNKQHMIVSQKKKKKKKKKAIHDKEECFDHVACFIDNLKSYKLEDLKRLDLGISWFCDSYSSYSENRSPELKLQPHVVIVLYVCC